MQTPGWVPVVLSGAFPRGLPDALAMIIIGVDSLNYSWTQHGPVTIGTAYLLLGLTVAFVSVLASRSDTARKLREELALIAYGGSSWQVWIRYFVRGLALTLIAITPLLYAEYRSAQFPVLQTMTLVSAIAALAGFCYSVTSLVRIRSREFAENYKG